MKFAFRKDKMNAHKDLKKKEKLEKGMEKKVKKKERTGLRQRNRTIQRY